MAKLVLYLPEPIEGCLLNIMHDAHLLILVLYGV